MSQGSLNVPTVGPLAPTAFAGDINTANDAIITKNSGATAPTNFPTTGTGATQGQDWIDTSPGGGIIDQRLFDGSSWVRQGRFDTTNHYWIPKWGGGSPISVNASAGGTISLAVNSTHVIFTNESLSNAITSFGSDTTLNIGEMRVVMFSNPGIITYNATSMICPRSNDIIFNINDVILAVYLGTGNWRILSFEPSSGRICGDIVDRYQIGSGGIAAGIVRCAGRTIGNGASGATESAATNTANLFILLYTQDSNLTVSGGRTAPGTTRAAAIIDYNLNKTITLPDLRGRITAGLDTMGAAASARLTDAFAATSAVAAVGTSDTLGGTVGEGTHTGTGAELFPHNHGVTDPTHNHTQNAHNHGVTDPNHTHTGLGTSSLTAVSNGFMFLGTGNLINSTNTIAAAATGVTINNATPTNNAASTGISITNAGAGTAAIITQPTLLVTKYIAL